MDSNVGYLFAAYAIIWLVIFGYCYRLSRRQEALRKRLESMKHDHRARALPNIIGTGAPATRSP